MILKITGKMAKTILGFALLLTAITGKGQTDPVEGLVRLNTFLQKIDLNVNVTYYYEEDDSAGVSRDTLSGVIKTKAGRTWMQLGGMKKISNEYYFALIDTVNLEMYVSDPQPLAKQYAATELTNPEFVSAYVDSIRARDSSTFSIITVHFNQAAPYNAYEVVYETSTLEPKRLSYSMKKEADTTNWVGSTLPEIRLKIAFTSYNTVLDEDIYNTNVYFTRRNGVLVVQGAYENYQIIDMTSH